jgi:iron complex outermembrane receptor protein
LGTANVINRADYVGFEDLVEFRYFTNSFDTKTQGVDIVGRMPFDLGAGSSSVSIAANYTDTEVTNRGNINPIGAARVLALEELLPKWKGNVTFNHEQGMWRGLVRASYFGGWIDGPNNGTPGAELLFDAEIGAEVRPGVELIVGANNIFNNYPDENPDPGNTSGQLYPEASPIGFNGGSYYVKARFTFD